jgi:hypothetical protein
VGIIRNIAATFFIGVVAGVSPFLFLQLLPGLLNPGQTLTAPNYAAIVVTGVLVGAICVVIFAKTFEDRDPQQVFFYTLGIPAILVATVSNITTKADALRAVAQTQAAASATILNLSPPPIDTVPLKPVNPPSTPGAEGALRGTAWAAVRPAPFSPSPILMAQAPAPAADYVVALGKYSNEAEAWRTVRELGDRRLRVESYVPKDLRVLRAGDGVYYVSYAAPMNRDEAVRLFHLIRINDPELAPQVIRAGR